MQSLIARVANALKPSVPAGAVRLRLPALSNDRHHYFHTLIQEAFDAIGHAVHIEVLQGLSQPQMWAMLTSGEMSLMWGGRTLQRDRDYLPVPCRATNGIAGMRVLLVRKGCEHDYDKVETLQDFRQLGKVGGVGAGWFEEEIWARNQLPQFVHEGDWNELFTLLGQGDPRLDYLNRAAHEALSDAARYPDLTIVPRLLLEHERDVRFYVSPRHPTLYPLVDMALAEAETSGLKKRLVTEHLLKPLAPLDLHERIRLRLMTPAVVT